MYHCHLHFYFVGQPGRVSEVIKEIPPLEHFTHEFSASAEPESALAAKADVIVADLRAMDVKESVRTLDMEKKEGAELILLAEQNQISFLTDDFSAIKDVWTMPMSDSEIRFRFFRWQQNCKMSKDFWETSHYLEATINKVPKIMWSKHKN